MATNDKKDTTVRVTDLPGELTEQGRNVWLAGLGALATVSDEGAKLFDSLVQRGSQAEKESAEQFEEATSELTKRQREAVELARERSAEASGTISKALADALERFGVPTRQEVTRLSDKVDTLARKVDRLTEALDDDAAATVSGEATAYAVAPHDDGWAVRKEDAEQAISVHDTKKEAREKGRTLAQDHQPSRLTVRKKDGSVQKTFSYGD